jgi:quercetin dioxygenase-like cupin family protein
MINLAFLMLAALQAGSLSLPSVPPVPGGCAAPATNHRGESGCFLVADITIAEPPAQLTWHLFRFADEAMARAEAARHELSAVAVSHDQVWLHILAPGEVRTLAGERMATAGPLAVPQGRAVTARLFEATFPPGMRTRVHAHPGPEAFSVVDGMQCMETPAERRMVRPGETFIVAAGPHIQAAPGGRRNLGLVLIPKGEPFMHFPSGWQPSSFCSG